MSPVTNDINERQSTDQFITYYSASSQLYSEAKTLTGWEAILSVPIPLILSVGSVLFPQYKVWAAFYGITLSFLNILFIESWLLALKKEAAKAQELFDCELFGLEWSSFRVGEKPLEKITLAANNYKKSHSEDELRGILKTWYPDVSKLPLELARIVCQRSNLWWDTELREIYARNLKIIVTTICVIAVGVGIGKPGMNMEEFMLSIMAVILPTILWFIKEIRKQLASVETLKRLTGHVHETWKKAIDQSLDQHQIRIKTRMIQDEIYAHRASNSPIFNWIHKRIKIKNNMDDQMNTGAQAMIEEASKVLGKDKA